MTIDAPIRPSRATPPEPPGAEIRAPGGAILLGGAARRRNWPKMAAYGAAFGAAGLALLVPTSTAGASWYLAAQLLDAGGSRSYPVRVRSIDGARVRLTRTPDLSRPIPLGLAWPGGHARLGAILDADRSTVVRAVTAVDRGTLRPGLRGYCLGRLFEGDPTTARGLPYTEIMVEGELGDMPAWVVPPTGPATGTWVIAVHGWRSDRTDVLRVLPALAAAGYTTLAMTYRNDQGAPPSADRCYHLGDTEWLDVAAAVDYAMANGATDVVLYGWSMGGAIVLNLLRRAEEAGVASAIRAAVLDCPVVCWGETLRNQARALNVPPPWTWTALRLVQRRLGAQIAELDQRRYTADLKVPVLMFVDRDDTTVAPGPALQYAAARPDLVTLVDTEGAGHCRAWNLDADRYEAQVTGFLAALP